MVEGMGVVVEEEERGVGAVNRVRWKDEGRGGTDACVCDGEGREERERLMPGVSIARDKDSAVRFSLFRTVNGSESSITKVQGGCETKRERGREMSAHEQRMNSK
jgi:hypothetical protein